jgi:hypothetical protein
VADWRAVGDILRIDDLDVVVQRIALEDWRAEVRLRSWGIAPIFYDGATLLVPCGVLEALWLGITRDDVSQTGRLSLRDDRTGYEGSAQLPDEYQLTSLRLSTDIQPIHLAAGNAERSLMLEWRSHERSAAMNMRLVSPTAWSLLSGREVPLPLEPPPLPPLLG